ncbi:glycoside hydrolase family 75 protein [Streptomyces sp. NBC_01497]|uniref:glycoside hydrolase family 75 protein n=1 Tax=Streptomyces sp. NBC_01497 TaxID=2903885 RepID=UPI002E341CF6|nr:glycoside hydrolase family 75 protein [Streptomyces sp. NBC_01497]
MRYRTHVVAAAGTFLAAASVLPHLSLSSSAPAERTSALRGALPDALTGAAGPPTAFLQEGSVTAAQLLARAARCEPESNGMFRMDDEDDEPAVPVCGTKGAVFWKADLDIDCDGRATAHCNEDTDSEFQNMTAFPQSDGQPLDAEELPYVVVPDPSGTWDYRASGIRGGGLAAVVHDGQVQYAIVGDTGPAGLIGEASYATAHALGITPDPAGGGTPKDVTYILFRNTKVEPLESHAAAVRMGDRLAREFVAGTR